MISLCNDLILNSIFKILVMESKSLPPDIELAVELAFELAFDSDFMLISSSNC